MQRTDAQRQGKSGEIKRGIVLDFVNLRSVIATARKQRWNVLETLAQPNPMQMIPKLRF